MDQISEHKNITLEQLAQMISDRFNHVDILAENIIGLDKRINLIEEMLCLIYNRLNTLEERVGNNQNVLNERFDTLEGKFKVFTHKIKKHDARLELLGV